MTQSRRALLLAIADYDPADPIPYVRGDLPRMQRALKLMGIPAGKIEAHGPGIEGSRDLSAARMRTLIQKFLDGAVEGENLIIYFSGHGIEQEGHRLLVPQDYDVDYPPRASELVSDVDLFAWSRRSKAASVLMLIDACREGVRLALEPDMDSTKSLSSKKPAQDATSSTEVPTIAIVFSCASGRFSGKDQNGECSAFTRAFAEAIEAEDELGHLYEVIAAAQRRLDELAATEQTIALGELRSSGRMGPAETLIVKANQAAQFRDRLRNSGWVCRLKTLKLWQIVHAAAPAIATQVSAIVLRTEDPIGEEAKMSPVQRWRTPDAPFRVLDRISAHLLARVNLEPAEAAVLLAVPFIYEVVLAAAESRLAAEGRVLNPLSDDEPTSASGFWRAWRVAYLSEQAEQRQIQRLRELGKLECAEDVAMWRLNAFCHRAGELWDAESSWVAEEVIAAIAAVPLHEVRADARVKDILSAHRLLRLARLMFAPFEDVTLDLSERRGSNLSDDIRFGEGAEELRLNEVKVVHLLNLGARLALDARRLPSVLVEHLGSDDRLTLAAVQDLLAKTAWHARDNVLALGLTCPHEALDAALREAVDDLDAYRRHLFDAGDRQLRLIESVPVSFNANDLSAEIYRGKPRYDTEHLRFTLEQRRVMGLLMGKELYGDPDLALRELYQNALDACRYRRAQETYIRKVQKGAQYSPEYHGQIVFRFGTEEGRRFIECLDNGIGMADRHLRRLFARAGERFTDSHEYHLDKARWETAGVAFFPNSRFGIGVLSYFMLAEEVELESQRVVLPDTPTPERVHACVLGSGSLFRIDREATSAVLNGGTRVRLYLMDRERGLSDYRESILKWLWLPEFRTILDVDGAAIVELPADRPTPKFEDDVGPLIPIAGSEGISGQARAFWCLGQKALPYLGAVDASDDSKRILMVDGILTGVSASSARAHIAINFTDGLRPELSVSRLTIISARRGVDYVQQCVNCGGWRSLENWKAPELSMFLKLFASVPIAATRLSESLRARDIEFPYVLSNPLYSRAKLPSAAGIYDIDEILFASEILARFDVGEWNPFLLTNAPVQWSRLLSARLSELGEAGLPLPPNAELFAGYARRLSSERCPPVVVGLFRSLPDLRRPFFPGSYRVGNIFRHDQVWPTTLGFTDLWLAMVSGLSVPEVTELSRAVLNWGFRVVGLDALRDCAPLSQSEKRLLSTNFDGEWPFMRSLGFGHLLEGTTRLSATEFADAARSLAARAVDASGLDGILTGLPYSDRELQLLSAELTGRPPYIDTLSFGHLFNAAARLRLSVAEIVEIAVPLVARGVRIPKLEVFMNHSKFSERQLALLSSNFEGSPPFVGELTWDHLLYGVRKLKPSAPEVADLLHALGPATLPIPYLTKYINRGSDSLERALRDLEDILPAFPEIKEKLARIEISDTTEALLTRAHAGEAGGPYSLSCWDLAGVATTWKVPLSSMIAELDKLEVIDVDVSDCRPFVQFCQEREGKSFS